MGDAWATTSSILALHSETLDYAACFSLDVTLFDSFSFVANIFPSAQRDLDFHSVIIVEIGLQWYDCHTLFFCLLFELPRLMPMYQQTSWSAFFMLKVGTGHIMLPNMNVEKGT